MVAATGWQSHARVLAGETRKIHSDVAPPSAYLGVLGMPGFTAYAGLLEIGRPSAGETLVVAAATDPVGSAVGQIARAKGLRTVGIAGGRAKCRALIDQFGFDHAVDHHRADFVEQLRAKAPEGVDIYFENVGGRVGEAAWRLLNKRARVPVCGLIADYNATEAPAGPDRLPAMLRAILTKSLVVRGLIQDEFVATRYEAFERDMSAWVADGVVAYREDFVDGLDSAPRALGDLLAGRNFGKVIVRL